MHLLDLKHCEIKDREYPQNVRPFYKQEVCIIPIILPKLNSLCEKCRFKGLITTRGKVDELGIDGYMSNQPDPLKPVKNNPTAGVTLREPRAIIMASGQVYICRHPKKVQTSDFFLMEEIPACKDFEEKKEFEYEKLKKK